MSKSSDGYAKSIDLKPWMLSGLLTPTRTVGQVGLFKNGTQIDFRVIHNGQMERISISKKELESFFASDEYGIALIAESDGNAE